MAKGAVCCAGAAVARGAVAAAPALSRSSPAARGARSGSASAPAARGRCRRRSTSAAADLEPERAGPRHLFKEPVGEHGLFLKKNNPFGGFITLWAWVAVRGKGALRSSEGCCEPWCFCPSSRVPVLEQQWDAFPPVPHKPSFPRVLAPCSAPAEQRALRCPLQPCGSSLPALRDLRLPQPVQQGQLRDQREMQFLARLHALPRVCASPGEGMHHDKLTDYLFLSLCPALPIPAREAALNPG